MWWQFGIVFVLQWFSSAVAIWKNISRTWNTIFMRFFLQKSLEILVFKTSLQLDGEEICSSLIYKLALNDRKKAILKSLLTIPISEVILPGNHIGIRHERCKRLLAMCKSSAKWRAIGRKLRKTKEQRMEHVSFKLHWRK